MPRTQARTNAQTHGRTHTNTPPQRCHIKLLISKKNPFKIILKCALAPMTCAVIQKERRGKRTGRCSVTRSGKQWSTGHG